MPQLSSSAPAPSAAASPAPALPTAAASEGTAMFLRPPGATAFGTEPRAPGDASARNRKKTKVVATIGPASTDRTIIRNLIHAGMNVVRLNMSHGAHADHLARLRLVREVAQEMRRPVAVLADLQGPKIRTGKLEGDAPVTWAAGQTTVITVADCPAGTAARVGTTYSGLARDVAPGAILLVDDGRMRLHVDAVTGDDIACTVLVGGLLKSNKGINLPGTAVSAPSLSDKDKADLAFAIANEVDYLALSFVRTARDVRNVKHRIAETGRTIPIIAKIEKPEAVDNIDEILAEADGIMVARGDLGIEISTQKLPVVQKELITRANRAGKLVITATQMLESMIENPIPTRAETSDVANAIFDGSDAIMLSGETATGKYPVEAVAEMLRIAVEAEKSPYMPQFGRGPSDLAGSDHRLATGHRLAAGIDRCDATSDHYALAITAAADLLTRELSAAGTMVFSQGTHKSLLLSKRRATHPVVAMCYDQATWRRMSLYWGIVPLLIPFSEDQTDLIEAGIEQALRDRLFAEGDTVVVISGVSRAGANTIRVIQV